jgi:hypothetical protein
MNKNRLLLIGIAMSLMLATTVQAQKRADAQSITWSNLGDTLSLKLDGNQRIFIVGPTFDEIPRQADSLIALFVTDYGSGITQDSMLEAAKEVYYIIHVSGKRRMKYANGIDENFNFQHEMDKLNRNLPPYNIIIYFKESFISIYLEDPSKISMLKNMHLNQVITDALSNKKLIRGNNRIESEYVSEGIWKTDPNQKRPRTQQLELGANFGVLVFPNHIGPELGLSLFYKYRNRYNRPINAFGYSFDILTVKDYKDVSDFNLIRELGNHVWHKFSFVHRIGENAIGLHYGYLYDATNQPYKLYGFSEGFSLHVKHISYSIDILSGHYNGFVFPVLCFGIKVGY